MMRKINLCVPVIYLATVMSGLAATSSNPAVDNSRMPVSTVKQSQVQSATIPTGGLTKHNDDVQIAKKPQAQVVNAAYAVTNTDSGSTIQKLEQQSKEIAALNYKMQLMTEQNKYLQMQIENQQLLQKYNHANLAIENNQPQTLLNRITLSGISNDKGLGYAALLTLKGKDYLVKQGQKIDGIEVKKIASHLVVLFDANYNATRMLTL
ncbi:hypothetical protein [Cysteiniphilum halobium]|uniref:hypothetical protein n=1 Tax=Cysteiniphilum halobium TaxID=2219059 RepID=UPI003F87085B